MKTHWLFTLLFASPILSAQTHTLNVTNGYGSGMYMAGDTVDVWSVAFYNRSYFDRWAGDTLFLNDPLDWHTRVVMPDHDVQIEAVIGELPAEANYITDETQGADTLKKIWMGLPGLASPRGLIWLFHGTNGSGENWFTNNDMILCIKKMMAEGFAVISLDCEERTRDTDLNGDGVFRWDYTFDSLQNIDLRNVKAIRDTLIARDWITPETMQIGYGYSAGGAFSTHISTQLNWHAGITHNASGLSWVPDFGQTPMLYSMTANDDHPEVGPQAEIEARAYVTTFQSRQICSTFRLAQAQPLYPERFNRSAGISLVQSQAIFNELKNNGALDDENYLLYKSNELLPLIAQAPANWPVTLGLSAGERVFVADEIDETYATHRFNSDLFGSDLRFILSLCEETTSIPIVDSEPLLLYPNPASTMVNVPNEGQWVSVFDQSGKLVWAGQNGTIHISEWPGGLYVVRSLNRSGKFVKL